MTDPVADATLAAAAMLAASLGPDLPAEVEAALHAREGGEQDVRFWERDGSADPPSGAVRSGQTT